VIRVESVRRSYEKPRYRVRGPEVEEVHEAVEVTIETSAPFPQRALGPVLLVGRVELSESERIGPNRYRFYAYDYKQLKWLQVAGDRLLDEHALPSKQLDLALELDGKDVRLEKAFATIDREKDPAPQVMILSSGELTPFKLDVSRSSLPGRYSLTGELNGKLAVAENGYASR